MELILELAEQIEDGWQAERDLRQLLEEEPHLLRNIRDRVPQKKLARMARVPQEYISAAESGDHGKIGIVNLVRILVAYATLNGD